MLKRLTAGFMAVALALSVSVLNAGQPDKNSFKETTAKLDAGGPFYLYYSSEHFCSLVESKINVIRDFSLENIDQDNAETKESVQKGFALAVSILKDSGLLDIGGVGVSALSIRNNIYRNKVFVQHYQDKGQGLIWKLFGKAPHSLKNELSMLPADTAVAQFSDFDSKLLWAFLKSEAEKSGILQFKQSLVDFENELKKKDIDLNKLLESCEGTNGVILTLNPAQKATIPLGFTKIAQIPQPGIAFLVKVKDDYLFNLLKTKLAPFAPPPAAGAAAAQPKADEKTINIAFPFPLPLPFLAPLIVQEDGYVIAASNSEILNAIRAAKKSGNGLVSTPEFKLLSADIPDEGNGFKFVGEIFGKTVADIQKQSSTPSEFGPDPGDIISRFNIMANFKAYGTWQVLDDGIFVAGNCNLSAGDILAIQATIFPTAIVAGTVLPLINSVRMRGRAMDISCSSNLKQIGLGFKQYSMDNDDKFPAADGAEGLEALRKDDYITDTRIYTCPSAKVTPAEEGQPLSEETVSYVYLGGFTESDSADMPLAFDKPSNHKDSVNVLYLDGHVAVLKGSFKNCADVVNAIKKQSEYSADDAARLDKKAAAIDAKTPAAAPAPAASPAPAAAPAK